MAVAAAVACSWRGALDRRLSAQVDNAEAPYGGILAHWGATIDARVTAGFTVEFG
jgi:hypothetical protein